jgi:L,D-transpeptidase catalytic domain
MYLRLAAVAALAALVAAAPARADLLIQIDKSTQQMTVTADGEQLYVWPVSTGVSGYDTPAGAFTPFRKEKEHYSREWDDAPMPYSVFFTQKGHAIHGTYHRGLGKPASHGCVRLSVQNAATLWALVAKHKMANTIVALTGEIPGGPGQPAVARARPRYDQDLADDEPLEPARSARSFSYDQPPPRYYYYDRDRYYYPQRQRGFFPFGW